MAVSEREIETFNYQCDTGSNECTFVALVLLYRLSQVENYMTILNKIDESYKWYGRDYMKCLHFKDVKEFIVSRYKKKYTKRCRICRDIINTRSRINYSRRNSSSDNN